MGLAMSCPGRETATQTFDWLSVTERRARDSNPQPLSGHHISSRSPDSHKAHDTNGLGQSPSLGCTPGCTGEPGAANSASLGNEDALAMLPGGLAQVVAAWPTLPDAIKEAILTMVRAVSNHE